ncbi:Lysine ketoglutarate reductase trans-splicing-like protein [Hirschfeldia incana]|nr:Lysine ketoglutarate reductase trans-splicing-like protein [Hirschfeldia incana]
MSMQFTPYDETNSYGKRKNNRHNRLRFSDQYGLVKLLYCSLFLEKTSLLGKSRWRIKPFLALICTALLIFWYKTTHIQFEDTDLEEADYLFDMAKKSEPVDEKLKGLPRGIIQPRTDLELKPLWSSSSLRSKGVEMANRNLLAIPVGIKQKGNVDAIVKKFLPANFTVVLFHYDGHMDQWWDLEWTSKAIHIVAQDQTKWWFAKRFLHPDVVSIYDYIFIWDEDLGVDHFSPERYLDIVKSEGLEISQPALDANSSGIHHKITVRSSTMIFHRRVYISRGHRMCSDASQDPPCTGFVEGMAPVFSRAAWFCTWNLIQNDLVHGWGMDMKLGYCAQGDRTKKVGIVDSEYIFHQGIQTLGESVHSEKKRHGHDSRTSIRRQSTWELRTFEERWNKAVEKDKNWIDPSSSKRKTNGNNRRLRRGKDNSDSNSMNT